MNTATLETKLAAIASAIADPTRARMLCALMDGRAYTATELSALTDVSASTASSHLARLQEQGLISCIQQSRYRYFRLSHPQVAEALENLMGLASSHTPTLRSSTPVTLRFARTCYDHLAGEIAVALHNQFMAQNWLEQDTYQLTETGQAALQQLGISLEAPPRSRRRFACSCLDWSERQFHLGGHLGTVLLRHFEQKGWVSRYLDSREVKLTPTGRKAMQTHFNLSFPAAPSPAMDH